MNKRKIGAVLCVFIGIAAIIVGVYMKETIQILNNAIYICLSCIGIG